MHLCKKRGVENAAMRPSSPRHQITYLHHPTLKRPRRPTGPVPEAKYTDHSIVRPLGLLNGNTYAMGRNKLGRTAGILGQRGHDNEIVISAAPLHLR